MRAKSILVKQDMNVGVLTVLILNVPFKYLNAKQIPVVKAASRQLFAVKMEYAVTIHSFLTGQMLMNVNAYALIII